VSPHLALPPASARRATNVTLDAALLAEAKSLQLNISQAAEAGLQRAVADKRAQLWLQANQAALDSSSAHVDQQGLPLARHRHF
jgi:antitoxin CcdA